ncbi:MAG: hypothetical protein ACRBBV_15475 [Paracoccaceae bacterium]
MTVSQQRHIVSVIGNARLPKGDRRLALAHETGRLLVDHGYAVMTGGMGGVMNAALEGARMSSAWSTGSCIALLPGSDPGHPLVSKAADLVIPTGLDHARNQIVAQSHAVIVIGGGAGTLTEMGFAWIHKRLLIAFRCEGWSGRLADERVDTRTRYPEIADDRVYGIDTAQEAISLLRQLGPEYAARHRKIAAE